MNEDDRRVFDALFAPRVIALIGASSDERKHTSRPQRALKRHGYTGTIIPVNPKSTEIFGDRAYPSVLDVPEQVDHAFIMVPPSAVPEAVRQCAERGVRVATIYADGFAESGPDGRARQDELVVLAREGGVRLLGPNCSGIYSSDPVTALSVNAAIEQLDITPGPLAVISQSGSMTGGLISRGLGRGVGFSRVVSIGNECDIAVGELTDWLVDDELTGAILLFLETLRDAPRLGAAARRAVEAGKPVVVYKLGRSDVGRDLAASHTGAMAGADEVADAFFQANGIMRVDVLETMFELPRLVAGHKPSARHRVAVMSTTGGGAATVVDRLGLLGVDVVPPSEAVVDRLAAQGIQIPRTRLTDLTHAGTTASVYHAVAQELLASDHCDAVLAVAGSSAQFQPEITVGALVRTDRENKPLAVFIAPHAVDGLAQLAEAGIAGFRTPESCADAIRAWSEWTSPTVSTTTSPDRVEETAQALAAIEGPKANELQSAEVFRALGISSAPSMVVQNHEVAVNLDFPVVAKVLSADITHKTDAGGVVLGITNQRELADVIAGIRTRVASSHPEARIDGILVQQMEQGQAEVILGYRRDPEVGPVVVLGVGGVLAEVYRDLSIRLAPVSRAEAERMVDEVKGLAVIRGYRGMPRADRSALVDVIVGMSELALVESPLVLEAEVNPLIVRDEGEGVVAVDGVIILIK